MEDCECTFFAIAGGPQLSNGTASLTLLFCGCNQKRNRRRR
jgi:hypothetical protein